MHHWFLRGLEHARNGPALRIGDVVRTYADLHKKASKWAGSLRSSTLGPPRRVGIVSEKNEVRYAGLLAALYSGATAVPFNPRWPDARKAHILRVASIQVLIVDEVQAGSLDWLTSANPAPQVFGPAQQEAATAERASYIAGEDAVNDIAYIIFTSGSTGEPKGVPISHGNVGAFLAAMAARFEVGQGDVFSQLFEISFDLSIFEIFAAWSTGACVCAVTPLQAASPERCIAEWGITVWTSTPSLATMLLTGDRLPPGSLAGLRYTVFCGEALHVRTANYWRSAAPRTQIDNLYGPTEAAVACLGFRLAPSGVPHGFGDLDTVPIGWPFPEVDCLLLPSEGELGRHYGELCLAGTQIFDGYLGAAGDAGHFVTRQGRRWYRTGDRVRQTENYGLIHLGRIDSQVKVNGYRIELSEVERAIELCLPGMNSGVVTVVGPGSITMLVAFVVGLGGGEAELRKNLAGELPPYMLPSRMWDVPQLPVNHNGKVDRQALQDLAGKLLR
jgi:amino acid adenylation domain-containing protein